jgi:hypothetical protein
MKQGSLFCFVCHIDIQTTALPFPNHNISCHTLGIFGKLSMSRGAPTWFKIVSNYNVETIDY